MNNEFAFFPGCVLSQAAKESKISIEAIAPILGFKLNEIKGWSCCGASQAQCVDPDASLVANARNLALAEHISFSEYFAFREGLPSEAYLERVATPHM